MAQQKKDDVVLIASNRRARHDYEIEDTFEAGIQLTGSEVKSLRAGKVTIGEGYVTVANGEAWLINVYIPEYTHADKFNHEPKRRRKLLLKRHQIDRIHVKLTQQGYTAVPLRLYFHHGWAKLEFGLGKGKKHYDKRQAAKKKDARREMRDLRR